MKNLFLFGAAALFLVGCDGGTCDTGDSACEAVSDEVLIQFVDGDCAGTTCTWVVEASGEMGVVELDLAETGDTSGLCDTHPNCSEEGWWTEFHDDFDVTDFVTDVSEEQSINLTLVGDPNDQVQNQTTLMDVSDPTIANQITWLFVVTDKNGDYADCAVGGHDPSEFASICDTVWE